MKRMIERRSDCRLLDSDLVMISWEEHSTKLRQLGNVEDLSLNGTGILVHNPLAIGTPVTLSYGEDALAGIVRHSSTRSDGHLLGIEFTESSKNSTLHFQPDLLVRL